MKELLEKYRNVTPDEFVSMLEENAYDGLDTELVRKSLRYAEKAHEGQKRKSGEPYITHPVGTALILMELRMDSASVAAALLHDVVEDTPVTLQDVEEEFGPEIARLVEGVTKISTLKFNNPNGRRKMSKPEQQVENLRKMLLAMTDDLRIILIKLADRLHNLSTLGALPEEKQKRIAKETLDIYTPLAHRLGIYKIKWPMEDLCLRYLNPNVYFELVRQISLKRKEREQLVTDISEEIRRLLERNGIEARIKGRPKSFYSIYRKALKRGYTPQQLDEIYDLIGLRVITASVKDCYSVLGILHDRWKPVVARFKDYIAVPKSNNYRSLHTTLFHDSGHLFEVQIRTEEMDEVAEWGVAAHWAYKEGKGRASREEIQKMGWLKQILEWHKDVSSSFDFIEGVKLDLLENQIFVFTPEGKIIELPAGSTPIDFAYAVHTEVGHMCVGAEVNGKIVPLTYELKTGQIVNILTSHHSKGPSRDWLNVVKTNRARQKIKARLREEQRNEDYARGREAIQAEIARRIKRLKESDVSVTSILKSDDFRETMRNYGFDSEDKLFVAIGRGDVSVTGFLNQLPVFQEDEHKNKPLVLPQREVASREASGNILVDGMRNVMVTLAKCCHPLPGDPIVGYTTRGRGVTVHRLCCPNLRNIKDLEQRKIPVMWDLKRSASEYFPVDIEVKVQDRPNMIHSITSVITAFKVNILSFNAITTIKNILGYMRLTLEVNSPAQLSKILAQIRQLPGVIDVYRTGEHHAGGNPDSSDYTQL